MVIPNCRETSKILTPLRAANSGALRRLINPDVPASTRYSLRHLPEFGYRSVSLVTANKAAVAATRKPRQQSGQEYIRCIYDSVGELKENGNVVTIQWLPANNDHELLKTAKTEARKSTRKGTIPQQQFPRVQSTTLSIAREKQKASNQGLPENVGKHSKRVDSALPGKHTRQLYNNLSWKEASTLAQLRTGMARLNGYLYRIDAVPSDQCACRQARETVEHFLFRCRKWTAYRTEMLQCTNTLRGNISYYLGGKSLTDNEEWKPDMRAVRATIRFAIATGRFDNT